MQPILEREQNNSEKIWREYIYYKSLLGAPIDIKREVSKNYQNYLYNIRYRVNEYEELLKIKNR